MAKIVTPVAAMALVTLVTVSGLRMAVQNLYNQGMMISEQIVSCVDAAGALDTDYTKMQSYTSNVIHEPSEQTIGGYSDALDQAYGRMVKNIEVFKKYANSSKEKETVLDLHEKLKGMYDYQQAQMQNAVYGTEIPEEVLAAESGYNTGILSDISELEKMIQADEKEAKAALKQAKILSNIVIAGSIAFTVLIFIIVVLIWTAMYLAFTPVGQKAIVGVQARYYLPILWLAIVAAYNGKLCINVTKTGYARLLTGIMTFITAYGLLAVLIVQKLA